MKRAYNYPSGCSKRLKKANKEEQSRLLQGAIEKFCISREIPKTLSNSEELTSEKVVSTGICKVVHEEKNILESEEAKNSKSVKILSKNEELTSEVVTSVSICQTVPEEKDISESEESENSKSVQKRLSNERKVFENAGVCVEENVSPIYYNNPIDPATWNNISDQFRQHVVDHPPNQNMNMIHLTEKKTANIKRSLTEFHFYRITKNGDKLKREWLVLSPSNCLLYCYLCKLFTTSNSALATTGFNDWKHASERLKEHENSDSHRKAVCTLSSWVNISKRIDSQLILQHDTECKYWQRVLTRVVAVVKFLAKRSLPFFGDNETIGSPYNGNFLGCLELLAEFDPFLAKHLDDFGNPGKGKVNYLSSTVVDEFVSLMAKKVSKEIINQVKHSKYFSIIVDSTPDMSHIDQLSFVIRYVDKSLRPVERFLSFIPIKQHTAEYLESTVLSLIESHELDIMKIRGQSYDNASNMSGKYSGLQARIKKINSLAEYIPCTAHTLNLVAMHSVESCTEVVSFFGSLQQLYNFFSVSTRRWDILKQELNKNNSKFTLKSHASTRWCADAEATKSLRQNYKEITAVLMKLSKSLDESALTRNEAFSLFLKFQKLETAINAVVWDVILQRFNNVSKQLQNTNNTLECILPLYESLVSFVKFVRENFGCYEKEAESLTDARYTIKRKKKVPKSRLLDDGDEASIDFSPRYDFQVNCHFVLCDSLLSELKSRKSTYETVIDRFSFLVHSSGETLAKANAFQKHYSVDLDENFGEEYQHFLPIRQKNESIIDTYQYLHKLDACATFSNVEVALKIFLTIPISNCTSERSFSLLKRLKSPLRSILGQEKLSSLALLSFENDLTSSLDYNDIIVEFANLKLRKRPIF